MTELAIRDALNGSVAVNSTVTVKGWVRTRRDSKQGFSFIQLHDGSCFQPIQVVADGGLPNYRDEILHLTSGCSMTATGALVESRGRGQRYEIMADSLEVVGWVEDPDTYPMAAKRHTFEHLREVAHLRPRTNTIGAIARVRHTMALAIHQYFTDNGFVWVNTPIITASDCEGAGELFRVSALDLANLPRDDAGEVDFGQDFFGRETFLTVSGQLNVESFCMALSKVYTFGPTFRAENSNTSRHLAEFWMIEPEVAFADLSDDADLAEAFLKAIIGAVLAERGEELAFFNDRVDDTVMQRLEQMMRSEFERMDYAEAVDILKRADRSFEFPVEWGLDLQSEHERYLTEEHVGRPVVVVNYPKDIKAFYMRLNDDGETVAAMDVLAPGMGEIIGGSAREERLDVLDARLEEVGLKEQLWWYRDLRRYGTVPHVGFGLGFERVVNYVTGIANIRDAIPFPRTPQKRHVLGRGLSPKGHILRRGLSPLPAPRPMQHPPFSTSRSEWRRAREQLESAGGRSTVGGWPRVRLWPWLDAALKVFGVCLRLIGLYERGCRNALDLHVMRLEFQFTDLPAALDGYRILHLTDLHLDGLAGIVPIAVERLRGLEADLCVLTGDYRKGTSGPYEQILPMLAELLSAVRAADGVYAILGNHDCAAMVEPVEALGLRMLLNESVEIEREDATLTLTGLDDVHWFYSEAALSALQCAPGRFKIALVHSAEIADRAAESGYALYLAGHSHAGQICLPGGRPLLTHMVRLRRYASGAWRCADLQGYTSSGVGTSGLPVRFNTRSEVALITLRRREPLRSRREDPSP